MVKLAPFGGVDVTNTLRGRGRRRRHDQRVETVAVLVLAREQALGVIDLEAAAPGVVLSAAEMSGFRPGKLINKTANVSYYRS